MSTADQDNGTAARPFIKTDQINSLQAGVEWLVIDLEEKLDRLPVPTPPQVSLPKHQWDLAGQTIGMCGDEVRIYLNSALDQVPDNPMLRDKFREFMMLAKLISGPDVDSQLVEMRAEHRKHTDRQLSANREYREEMRKYEQRRSALKINHDAAGLSIRKQWKKIVKSLVALKRKYPDLTGAHPNDVKLLRHLEYKNKVEIKDNTVIWVNEDGLLDFSYQDIQEAVEQFK